LPQNAGRTRRGVDEIDLAAGPVRLDPASKQMQAHPNDRASRPST